MKPLNTANYSAIIFDLGGVIINLDYQATVVKMAELGISQFDNIFSKAKQNHLSDQFECGQITPQQFFGGIMNIAGLEVDVDQMELAWNAMLLNIPIRRLQLIEELGKTMPVFLLSNTNLTHANAFNNMVEELTGKQSFNPWFNTVYLSFELGLRKPDAAIFNHIIAENQLNPSTTLFIDDSLQHIEGAKKVGLQTHHLKDNENINDLFKL